MMCRSLPVPRGRSPIRYPRLPVGQQVGTGGEREGAKTRRIAKERAIFEFFSPPSRHRVLFRPLDARPRPPDISGQQERANTMKDGKLGAAIFGAGWVAGEHAK